MYKLNFLVLILILLFLNSCSSLSLKEKEAIAFFSSNIKSQFYNKDLDTLEIVDTAYVINRNFIDEYSKEKRFFEEGKILGPYYFNWVNSNNSWIFDNKDITIIKSILENQEALKLKSNFFKKSVKFYKKTDALQNNSTNQSRYNNGHFIFEISLPIFNTNKEIFIIECRIPNLPNSQKIFIYKKINGIWTEIGNYYVVTRCAL